MLPGAWIHFRRQARDLLMPTTANDIRELLRRRTTADRIRRMSPERRAQYENIMSLRREIGPLGIDVVELVREMRS